MVGYHFFPQELSPIIIAIYVPENSAHHFTRNNNRAKVEFLQNIKKAVFSVLALLYNEYTKVNNDDVIV